MFYCGCGSAALCNLRNLRIIPLRLFPVDFGCGLLARMKLYSRGLVPIRGFIHLIRALKYRSYGSKHRSGVSMLCRNSGPHQVRLGNDAARSAVAGPPFMRRLVDAITGGFFIAIGFLLGTKSTDA